MNFDHIVLNVENMDKMLDFYEEIMRFSIERLQEYENGSAPFPIARMSGDSIIDLFPKKMWSNGGEVSRGEFCNMNHFCLVLADNEWSELKQRLHDNNIKIEEGPVKRDGAKGEGVSIYFRDPDGNLVEARYYEK